MENTDTYDYDAGNTGNIGNDEGFCPSCDIPMSIQGDEYICDRCRCVMQCHKHFSSEEYGRHGASDVIQNQLANIYETLLAARKKYLGAIARQKGIDFDPNKSLIDDESDPLYQLAPPPSVLAKVAQTYNMIQEREQREGNISSLRGDVRKEILAELLSLECDRGLQFGKKNIAVLMGLQTDGFRRGHEFVLLQINKGVIVMESESKLCDYKIEYFYANTIGARTLLHFAKERDADRVCLDKFYVRFIREVIECSMEKNIGIKSQLASRIVGVIWFMVQFFGYCITISEIEDKAGIMKATFLKPSRQIMEHPEVRKIINRYFPRHNSPCASCAANGRAIIPARK